MIKELVQILVDFGILFLGYFILQKIENIGYKKGYQDGLHDRKDELKFNKDE